MAWCEELEKEKKSLCCLVLGNLSATGFTCKGGTSSVGYLCENVTKTQ